MFFPTFQMSFVGKTNKSLCLIFLKMEVRKHFGGKGAGKDKSSRTMSRGQNLCITVSRSSTSD